MYKLRITCALFLYFINIYIYIFFLVRKFIFKRKRKRTKDLCFISFLFCRSKSSPGVSRINKLDGSFEPSNSEASILIKSEQEIAPLPRDRTAILEQRVLLKGSNKYVFVIQMFFFFHTISLTLVKVMQSEWLVCLKI